MRILILTMIGVFFCVTACVQAPKSDDAQVSDPKVVKQNIPESKTYNIETNKSLVTWVGTKPTGRHNGSLNITKGRLGYKDGNITSGKFDIDMSSLKVLDMDDENNNNLAGHLMSEEFFKVKQHPKSTFVITSVVAYKEEGAKPLLKGVTHTVTGNLTMLGTTKSISFPAKISINANTIKAEANFNIDRTNWGINYNSDKSLGDKFIRPDVNIGLNIVAE